MLANVHADPGDNRQQLERAGYLLERFARGAPMLLGGDLNAPAHSPGVRALVARGWIEDSSDLDAGIDHLFVRGLQIETASHALGLPERRAIRPGRRRCPCGCPTTTRSTR